MKPYPRKHIFLVREQFFAEIDFTSQNITNQVFKVKLLLTADYKKVLQVEILRRNKSLGSHPEVFW